MSLIKGFTANTIWKAFVLNALLSSVIILLAIVIKGNLDNYIDKQGNQVKRKTSWRSILITFVLTFITTLCAYLLMHFIFGFGGGMLAD